MKVFSVSEPLFKVEPLFIVDCSYEQLRRYCGRHYGIDLGDEDSKAIGYTYSFEKGILVWVKDGSNLAALVHELFHLVTCICESRGVPIHSEIDTGENGDEAPAYMMEFFARECFKRLKVTTRKGQP